MMKRIIISTLVISVLLGSVWFARSEFGQMTLYFLRNAFRQAYGW